MAIGLKTIKPDDSIKILDIVVSAIVFVWAVVIGWRSVRLSQNSLSGAFAGLFAIIAMSCVWSIVVISNVRTRFWVVASHLVGQIMLIIDLEWLHQGLFHEE